VGYLYKFLSKQGLMSIQSKAYVSKVQKLSYHFERELYKILASDPEKEWYISEIQDHFEQDWGIRPYRSSFIKHAKSFYREHHIPLIYRAGFDSDKYKLNTEVDQKQLKAVLFPKRGPPRKYPPAKGPGLDESPETDDI